MELNKLLAGGLLPMETYQQFAICVACDTHIYGVKDDNEIVLASLANSLPSETLNLILFSHRISQGDLDAQVSSVIAFTEYMKCLVGPHQPSSVSVPLNHTGPDRSSNRTSSHFDPCQRRNNGFPGRSDAHLHNSVDKPFNCALCGPNNNHGTTQCKHCNNCHKIGHSQAQCHLPSAIAHSVDHQQGTSQLACLNLHSSVVKIPFPEPNMVAHQNNALNFTSHLQALPLATDKILTYESGLYDSVLLTLETETGLTLPATMEHVSLSDNDFNDLLNNITHSPLVASINSLSHTLPVVVDDMFSHDLAESPAKKQRKNHPGHKARECSRAHLLSAIPSNGFFPSTFECGLIQWASPPHKEAPPRIASSFIAEQHPLLASLLLADDIDLDTMLRAEFARRQPVAPTTITVSSLHAAYLPMAAPVDPEATADRRPFISVFLEGEKYDALIDTGATNSCISQEVVERHGKIIQPHDGTITLADESQTIPRIGQTESIEVRYGPHIVSAPFEVLEHCCPFIIGMDLFHELGLGISGLTDPGDDATRMPFPTSDSQPTLVPGEVPKEEQSAAFIAFKTQFLSEIKESLDHNSLIPKSSSCPVPEMKVFLPVPKGTVLFHRPCPYAERQQPIVDETVNKWLNDDVITLTPVSNVHNNTLTLATKKDENGDKTLWRVCLDPQPLNKELPDDKFPLPLVSDILTRLAGHSIFTMLDLTQAYHRLPIHEVDQPLTAFMHQGKQYMFKKAPFGLKPLSSLFKHGMSHILGDLPFILNFLDDIVVYSCNREEHATHVRTVINWLNAANLILNHDKCTFYSTQISLLGFVVGLQGKSVDPRKFANIDEWVEPTTAKQIQSYLGTFNFFHEYIPLISTVAVPLDPLQHSTAPFILNEEQHDAFFALKRLLTHAPVLSFPDFSLPFYVATDASDVSIGAVLYQLPSGPDHPADICYISFMACSLQASECKYSATKKELLGVVFALTKFHYYLWGCHFDLYTDHCALTFMHSQ